MNNHQSKGLISPVYPNREAQIKRLESYRFIGRTGADELRRRFTLGDNGIMPCDECPNCNRFWFAIVCRMRYRGGWEGEQEAEQRAKLIRSLFTTHETVKLEALFCGYGHSFLHDLPEIRYATPMQLLIALLNEDFAMEFCVYEKTIINREYDGAIYDCFLKPAAFLK